MRSTMLWVGVFAGCSGDPDPQKTTPPPTDTGTPHTTDTSAPPPGPDLVVTAGALYSVAPTYTIAPFDVRSKFDVLVSWPTLETDGWGDPIDPATIPNLFLLEVGLSPDELGPRFAADDLGAELISTWSADVGGRTNAHLSDLSATIGGSTAEAFDPVDFLLENRDKSWVLGLGSTDGLRLDLRVLGALAPSDTSTETAAPLTGESSSFTFASTLGGTPLATSEGWDLYTVDWSALEADVLGRPYDRVIGDELFIGRFDSAAAADLGASVLEWPSTADAWFTMDVARETDARLDFAKDTAGTVFPGFTPGPTWVIGVRCSTCLSPFPLWATTVDVSSRDVTSGT